MKLTDLVAVPKATDINSGLSPAHQATMLQLLGKPGQLTRECSGATNKLAKLMATDDVGPFRVTGHAVAIACLKEIFQEVEQSDPELYAAISSEGMLCVRAVRGSNKSFSNHSWGTAVDIKVKVLDQYGAKWCRRGLVKLYYYFHKHGWYWGAGFPTCDPMHFEMSDELVREKLSQ